MVELKSGREWKPSKWNVFPTRRKTGNFREGNTYALAIAQPVSLWKCVSISQAGRRISSIPEKISEGLQTTPLNVRTNYQNRVSPLFWKLTDAHKSEDITPGTRLNRHPVTETLNGGCRSNTYFVNLTWRSTANRVSNANTVDASIIHSFIKGQ